MNKARGEITLTLGGRDWVLRPTFQALCEIESELGDGLIALVRRLAQGSVGVRDVAVIVHAGIKAVEKKPPSYDKVGQMVIEAGIVGLLGPLGEFLGAAFSDSEDADGAANGGDTDAGQTKAEADAGNPEAPPDPTT